MKDKGDDGQNDDMFYGTVRPSDKAAEAPSSSAADASKKEEDKPKKKKQPKAPPVIEQEGLKKRNVKRDIIRLRKSGTADGLRGQSQMETLRHELEKRQRHQAEKSLAKALKKTKQFEMRKIQRNIKSCDAMPTKVKLADAAEEEEEEEEDEEEEDKKEEEEGSPGAGSTKPAGKKKKKKNPKGKSAYQAELDALRAVDTAALVPHAIEYLDVGTKLVGEDTILLYRLIGSKHVKEAWREFNPDKLARITKSKRQLKRERIEKRKADGIEAPESNKTVKGTVPDAVKKQSGAKKKGKLDRSNLSAGDGVNLGESEFISRLDGGQVAIDRIVVCALCSAVPTFSCHHYTGTDTVPSRAPRIIATDSSPPSSPAFSPPK